MRTVRLFGELGKRFGRVHRFEVNSPAEAVRALCANFSGFDRYMIDSRSRNLGFKVINGGAAIEGVEHIHDPASGEIRIIPVIMGSSAVTRIFIGAALIAASFLIPGSTGFALTASSALFSSGVALALGGVVQLLSPVPGAQSPQERPEDTPSYLFNGPVNTTAQGHPVPIGYGRAIVGGAVISAGLSIEQLKGGFRRTKVESTVTLYTQRNVTAVDIAAGYSFFYSDSSLIVSATRPESYLKVELVQTNPSYREWLFTYFVWTEVPL